MTKYRRASIIINPKNDQSIVERIEELIKDARVNFKILITDKEPDSAYKLARKAISSGTNAVIACGGDGTVMECARASIKRVPFGIIPCGTLNVTASSFGIPTNLEEAFYLIISGDNTIKKVDVGEVVCGTEKRIFLQRTSIGYEALSVSGTSSKARRQYGQILSHTMSFMKEFVRRDLKSLRFQLTLDNRETLDLKGYECFIANIGAIEPGNYYLDKISGSSFDIEDGLLNIVLMKKENFTKGEFPSQWLAKQIEINSTSSQCIQCDGEYLGNAPAKIKILPNSLKVIVPSNSLNRKTYTREIYSNQSYCSEQCFPFEYIKKQKYKNYYITSLAYDGELWYVVTSKGTKYTNQVCLEGDEFPGDQISKYWNKKYRITSLAHGDKWYIIMSRSSSSIGKQSYDYSSDFPKQFVLENWEENLYVTDIARSDSEWVAIMSEISDFSYQRYIDTTNDFFPAADIYECFAEDQHISSLDCYGDEWVIIFSKINKPLKQIFITRKHFPSDEIKKYWKDKFFITNIIYGNLGWTVLMSKIKTK